MEATTMQASLSARLPGTQHQIGLGAVDKDVVSCIGRQSAGVSGLQIARICG